MHADETPTTVRLEDQNGSKRAYIWCYGVGNKWVYDFTMTRNRFCPQHFLGDWRGALVTDGYAGYDEVVRVNGISRGGCWSHARRKVKEALDTGATEAVPLARAIGRLFWLERAVKRRAKQRKLDDEARVILRADVRSRLSATVLAEIRELVLTLREQRSTLPKSALGKALTYINNQWGPLTLMLAEPAMAIHNNDAERALRHVVIGRKNWMFFGSERGGKMGACLFSLIATCKALDINPEAYLEDVITRVNTETAIEKLTPWAWAAENGTQPS
ncbi:MAG: transposase [Chlamydiales bacterium]